MNDLQFIVRGQEHAIETLARLLHTQRQEIATCIAREKSPLPLPNREKHGDGFIIDANYLHALKAWVADEETGAEKDAILRDLDFAEHELKKRADSDWFIREWSIEESIGSFPPGYFLG